MNTKWKTSTVTGLAMVSAIAYVVMLAGFRFMASAPFLKYEAKDVILTIGGFIYGPIGAMAASFVVAFVEMVTISESGPIGFLMNFLAASSYACIASLIYHKKRTPLGAVLGLAVGSLTLTAVMLLWNYIITPIYTGWSRESVAALLVPVFLPFNLIKGGLNTAFVLLIYKPLMTALRAARLLPHRSAPAAAPAASSAAAATSAQAETESPAKKFKVDYRLLVFAGGLLIICATAIFYNMK